MVILEGKEVTKFFGGLLALSRVDFHLKQGEILGLIGPNGAGKTTLFNIISGLIRPTAGTVFFDGRDVTGLSPNKICRMGIARTYQSVRPFLRLTALENVKAGLLFGRGRDRLKPRDVEEEARHLLDFIGLSGKANQRAGSLPTADRKRLEVARALATHPRVLLLDEVVAGLTPAETSEIMAHLKEVRGQGITIFLIEHVMKAIMGLSDRIIVLHHGEKIAEGKPQEVARDKRVIDAYLGEAAI